MAEPPPLVAAASRMRAEEQPVAPPAAADYADEAELDALRGELVRELNRLAERGRRVD